MALTKIRGAQIRDFSIVNNHVAENAAISYTKLDLAESIVATDLAAANGSSVHRAVLESRKLALWDVAMSQSVSGTSMDVTTEVNSSSEGGGNAVSGTEAEGVLTTGSTMDDSSAAAVQNYRVQIRNSETKEPVHDQWNGSVFGTLSFESDIWTLSFYDSENEPFEMALPEIQTVTTVADNGRDLNGKYFLFKTPDYSQASRAQQYAVWYNVGGTGTAPTVDASTILVQVSIDEGVPATTVATNTATAIDALEDVSASASGDVVTITNDEPGDVPGAKDGPGNLETGFTFDVTQQGTPDEIDFMFVEVFSYQTAPPMSFINGVGFADIVGIAGTHHHNELYYTKYELEGGQLDDRYYYKPVLDSLLSDTFYTKTELGSTTPENSGAALIGVDPSEITGLDATNVQDALEEIQGDINGIGDTVSDLGLDEAYQNGSVVSVDGTEDGADVDWQLANEHAFKVTDGTSETYFEVSRDTEGDSTVSLSSTGELTLKDEHLTNPIALSQEGEEALDSRYTDAGRTSIIGAINYAADAAETAGNIGPAELPLGDPNYEDGLFTDFIEETPTGTAVDRFNRVLKSLSPQPAPVLENIGTASGGTSGKLSFGTSNAITGYTNVDGMDVGGNYNVGGNRMGIFAATGSDLTGNLANNVPAGGPNNRPYPQRAFSPGNTGTLELLINGTAVHTVDLEIFGSGASLTGGSGFNLSASEFVKFDNGDDFDVFTYRTGNWRVAKSSLTNGYNTIQVRHTVGTAVTTNTLDLVIDDATAATAYDNEAATGLSMTGSNYISGVEYHEAGTFEYAIDVQNAYRNTFNAGGSAMNFSGVNATAGNEAIPDPTSEDDDINVSGKTFTISTGSRLLDATVTGRLQVARTLQTTSQSSGASIGGILLDATSDNSSVTNEPFNGETYRIGSDLDIETTSGYTAGGASPSPWDSGESLVGAAAGHNTGLLVYNGQLMYPTQGLNSGNFNAITNGAADVDYSSASGNRTFLRFFHSATPRQNFRLNVTATGTSFVSVATGPSGNNLTMEVLAPNTTRDGSDNVVWKDGVVSFTDEESVGCYASTYGNSIPTNWGMTLGTKNTSTSGNVIVIRITASTSWTGNISNIALTWL